MNAETAGEVKRVLIGGKAPCHGRRMDIELYLYQGRGVDVFDIDMAFPSSGGAGPASS